MRRFARFLAAVAIAGVPALAACSDSTSPSSPLGVALSVGQLDSTIATGPTRIEIQLPAGSMNAREVHVEAEDLEEKITSTITAIDPVAGTVTLELGGLVVSYTDGTRFRTRSESHATRAAFETAVATALAAGGTPAVEARRNAPAQPQAPTDPSFTATDLRLADRNRGNKLEVYVDSDNYSTAVTAPVLATLTVFNLAVNITDATELSDDDQPGQGDGPEGEFEGMVASVDSVTGTITLVDGRIINAGAASFETGSDFTSLGAMAVAVAAGSPVKVEGNGTVASAGPPMVIDASSIKPESEDENEGGDDNGGGNGGNSGSGNSGSGGNGGNDDGPNHT